jgi:hypothetical protein
MVPLDLYPSPHRPNHSLTFDPFEEEVEYFVIDGPEVKNTKKEQIETVLQIF